MNEIKRKANINRAIQVINKTQEGLTITEACKEVGLPRSSYYYIVQTEQEALAHVLDMIRISHMKTLALILESQISVLQKVIDDGLSEKTKPRERIAIHKHLVQRKQELLEGLQNFSNDSHINKEDFNGPTLHLGTSSNTSNTKQREKQDSIQS